MCENRIWSNVATTPSPAPFFSPQGSLWQGCVSLPRVRAANYYQSNQSGNRTDQLSCIGIFVPPKNEKREPKFLDRPNVVSNNYWKSSEPTKCACLAENQQDLLLQDDILTTDEILESIERILE